MKQSVTILLILISLATSGQPVKNETPNFDSLKFSIENFNYNGLKRIKMVAGDGIKLIEGDSGTISFKYDSTEFAKMDSGSLKYALLGAQMGYVGELPKDEFLRVDTVHGVVRTININGVERVEKGYKISEVFKVWYDQFIDPNKPTRIGPGLWSSTLLAGGWSVQTKEDPRLKEVYVMRREFVKVTGGMMLGELEPKQIDLTKWYEFIPNDKLQ